MAMIERKRRYYGPEFKRDAVELAEKDDQTLAENCRLMSYTIL